MPYRKTVVIGVTGGIAAYKALDVVSNLKKNDIDVHVIMTKSAVEFVNPLSFQTLSQNAVIYDMFKRTGDWKIEHISLAKMADLIAVVPATANIIGKIASGIADDMLSTTIMASKSQVVFCPAMNTNMYSNPIVQDNIKKLRTYGYKFINPVSGRLACGDTGDGKLENTDTICEAILSLLYEKKDLKGRKVLVTAGPTRADIDPVRFITNRSTGKMGYAVAYEARDRGAQVVLISGNCNLKVPYGITVHKVNTNHEMFKAVLDDYSDSDIVVMAAAVADYKPENYSNEKIKKKNSSLILNMVKDTDILAYLGKIKDKQILVGFAAESSELTNNAKVKLTNKNLDYIVANNIKAKDSGFASDDNKVMILCKNGEVFDLNKMPKKQVAGEIFNLIEKRR